MKHSVKTVLAVLASSLCALSAMAQGTAFTYQGRLNDTGQCADGQYDFQFTLYNAASGSGTINFPANLTTTSDVLVSNGLFTVLLDFGSTPYTGQDLWLETDVRTNGSVLPYGILSPRQQLTPAPYAIYATTAGNVANSSITASQLDTSGSPNSGEVLTYNGSSLVWASPGSANAWLLNGNSGTSSGANFLGTTDNETLELRVNNTRALLLQPGSGGYPNIIGGGATSSLDYSSIDPSDGGATIAGGVLNVIQADADQSTIGGGAFHTIQPGANNSTIGGGYNNRSGAAISVIGGGSLNYIQTNASGSTIAGGVENNIAPNAQYAFVGGGFLNNASGIASFVGGGGYDGLNYGANAAFYPASTVVGGVGNIAEAYYATVGGGYSNTASSYGAFVGGGFKNAASGGVAIVGGGLANTAGNLYATVGGGQANTASGIGSFVGGGGYDGSITSGNAASGAASVVAGGLGNSILIDAYYSAIGGGRQNSIQNSYESTIAGGANNAIQEYGYGSFIGGGSNNLVQSLGSKNVICGGAENNVGEDAVGAVIGGGEDNVIDVGCLQAVIGGGASNYIEGSFALGGEDYGTIGGGLMNFVGQYDSGSDQGSTVPGGEYNVAKGTCSFAAGYQANAIGNGVFVWADFSPFRFFNDAANEFAARATGGVRFVTAIDGSGNPTAGVTLASGGTSWGAISDRNAKKNFAPVDEAAVLSRLAQVPVQQWNYKWESDGAVPHIGPMAQDFKKAFYPGRDDKSITTLEFDGVELAAIKGLNQKLEDSEKVKDAEIQQLQQSVAELKEMVSQLAQSKTK